MKLKLEGKEGTYIKIRGISLYGNHEIIVRKRTGTQGKVLWNGRGRCTNKERRQALL